MGHQRHVLCNCFSITYRKALPAEVWVQVLTYLDYFDLLNVKSLSKFFLECSKALSIQKALFTAPFEQESFSDLEPGSQVQLHPALSQFSYSLERNTFGFGNVRSGIAKVGKKELSELSELKKQNATNPPSNKIEFIGTEWTAELLREFCLKSDFYEFGSPHGYSKIAPIGSQAKPLRLQRPDPFASFKIGSSASNQKKLPPQAVTVGDLLESSIIHFDNFQHSLQIHWDNTTLCDSVSKLMSKDPEISEEDEGWEGEFSWEAHFLRLQNDEWASRKEERLKNNPINHAHFFLEGSVRSRVLSATKQGRLILDLRNVKLSQSLVSSSEASILSISAAESHVLPLIFMLYFLFSKINSVLLKRLSARKIWNSWPLILSPFVALRGLDTKSLFRRLFHDFLKSEAL